MHLNNASKRLTLVHELERLIDLRQWERVRDVLVDFDLATDPHVE